MTDFVLTNDGAPSVTKSDTAAFLATPRAMADNQRVYSILKENPYARITVETIAERLDTTYLGAYRIARRLVKSGLAERHDIDWPITDKKGRMRRIIRVAIRYVSPMDLTITEWEKFND